MMSNESSSAYAGACRKDTPYPSVSSESVPSLIDNLVYALYGTITKSVINRRVVWNIPCDPNNTSTINNIPRNSGEGLLCYIIRALNLTGGTGIVTTTGTQALSNKTLTAPIINGATLFGVLNGGTFTSSSLTSPLINNLSVTGTLSLPTGSITTAMIANGTIVPADLSTGGPSWNGSGVLTATSFVGPLSGNATTATSATTATTTTNVSSGVAGAIPYQLAPSTTGFTNAGTAGQVLLSNGTSAPTWSTNIAGNSGTATQLQASRTLGISGDVTGSASFDGSANATIAGTIANGVVTAAKLGTNEQSKICKAWVWITGLVNTNGAAQTFTGNNVTRIVRGATAGLYTITLTSGSFAGSVVVTPISTANNAGARVVSYAGNTCNVQMYVGVTATDLAFNMVYFSY